MQKNKNKSQAAPSDDIELVSAAEVETYRTRFRDALKRLKSLSKDQTNDWRRKNVNRVCIGPYHTVYFMFMDIGYHPGTIKPCDSCLRRGNLCLPAVGRVICERCVLAHKRCSRKTDFEVHYTASFLSIPEAQCRRFYRAWGRPTQTKEKDPSSSSSGSDAYPSPPSNPIPEVGPSTPRPLSWSNPSRGPAHPPLKSVSFRPPPETAEVERRQLPGKAPLSSVPERSARHGHFRQSSAPPWVGSPQDPTLQGAPEFRQKTGLPSILKLNEDPGKDIKHSHHIKQEKTDVVRWNQKISELQSRMEAADRDLKAKREKERQAFVTLKASYDTITAENAALRLERDNLKTQLEMGVQAQRDLEGTNEKLKEENANLKTLLLVARAARGRQEQTDTTVLPAKVPPKVGKDSDRVHRALLLSISNLANFVTFHLPPVSQVSHSDVLALAQGIPSVLNRMVFADNSHTPSGLRSYSLRKDGGIEERIDYLSERSGNTATSGEGKRCLDGLEMDQDEGCQGEDERSLQMKKRRRVDFSVT